MIDWSSVFVDLLVTFAGVGLAFALTYWYDRHTKIFSMDPYVKVQVKDQEKYGAKWEGCWRRVKRLEVKLKQIVDPKPPQIRFGSIGTKPEVVVS
jgi:hypothetical protein